jgi:hypothetical protein
MFHRAMMQLVLVILGICTALSPSAVAQTRLGLHVTQEELAIWRQRAASGPYKTAGDVSTNSPGDWNRIVSHRNDFASNPSNGRWTAPFVSPSGCVEANDNTYGWPEPGYPGSYTWSMRLRDAAFHNLVMGVTTDRAAIKQELLWVSSQSFTKWGNPSGIWCFNAMVPRDSAPTFGITSIMTRVLFAYDYVGRAAFSQAELDQLDRWFFDAADFWRGDMDIGLNGVYVDRWNGNYTKRDACSNPIVPYVGGPTIYSYAQFYNNRRGGVYRFTGIAGLYLQQVGRNYTNGRAGTLAQVVQSAKMYVQEFVRFGTFPQGLTGDFERPELTLKDLGWAYAGPGIGEVAAIADTFARAGDQSLYQYNTSLGDCGTSGTINDGGSRNGQNRDLFFAVQSYMKYITDVYARYWPDTSTLDNRVDGRDPRNGTSWHGTHETHLVMTNLYYEDNFVRQAYTRTHANSIPYPSSPSTAPVPWMGENAVFPGILFMFGQMEGKVRPYPGTDTSLESPTNLRVISPAP